MGTIEIVSEITDTFIEKLREQKEIDSRFIEKLKNCLSDDSKVTAAKVEAILYEESDKL